MSFGVICMSFKVTLSFGSTIIAISNQLGFEANFIVEISLLSTPYNYLAHLVLLFLLCLSNYIITARNPSCINLF